MLKFIGVLIIGVMLLWSPVDAQQDLVSLSVEVGYEGRFRENHWTPILVSVTNNGEAIDGKLIVRRERSSALTNTFSTPITLASGARQTVFLYATLQSFGTTLRVELLSQQDEIITELEVPIRPVGPDDKLYIVVSGATNSVIDLNNVVLGGNSAFQANWFMINIPDYAAALNAVDLMIFNNVDTGTLTPSQRNAIQGWVRAGGHLFITGGANWQATAAGFNELLPIALSGSAPVDNISALAELAGDYTTQFEGSHIAATGRLAPNAEVLALSGDNQPLLIRQTYGNGTVDYLTIDPSLEPLQGWERINDLFFTVLTSTDTRPGWIWGIRQMDNAIDGLEILPGYTSLPEAASMLTFLIVYIALVGPVNYLVLQRLNRRELAWITIPILILVFSGLAWFTGFNLRGTDVLLSRLTLVQTWPEQEQAQIDQLIGLIAPRRGNYTLATTDNRLLRPIYPLTQSGSFLGDISAQNVEIQMGNRFEAQPFPVDASFTAAFNTTGTTPKPAINGQATITYNSNGTAQQLRGSVRNDSELTLLNPVILARGIAFQLPTLAPGDLYVFNESSLILTNYGAPSATRLEYSRGVPTDQYYYGGYNTNILIMPDKTAQDIIGEKYFSLYTPYFLGTNIETVESDPETQRRQRFLNAFMFDQHYTTNRGDKVYLAAWTNTSPIESDLAEVGWQPVDSTLYLIELATEIVPDQNTVINGEQFTWALLEGSQQWIDTTPANLNLYDNTSLAFRFTPLPTARLSEVERLFLVIDFGGSGARPQDLDIDLWNWSEERWQRVNVNNNRFNVPNYEAFVGPLNSVQVRLTRDGMGGFVYVERISVEQRGTLEN
ncbi:MAG: hypothetical protein MUF87_11905 [Anaerolineae bacterium]|nr:hypothetical protein [Anaerolineae bacterium]